MRTLPILTGILLAFGTLAIVPGADAAIVACTDATNSACPGFVCVNSNRDGKYQYDECEPRYCTCPPPRDPW